MSKVMTTEQANYIRAVTVAGAVVAASDTSDATAKEVAFNIGEVAAELAAIQDAYFSKNGFEAISYAAPKTGGGGGGGGYNKSGGGGSGLSEKQEAALDKAFKAILERGETPPHTKEEILALSREGGEGSPRSLAIGQIFDQGFGRKF